MTTASDKVFQQVIDTAIKTFTAVYELDDEIVTALREAFTKASRGVTLPPQRTVITTRTESSGRRAPRPRATKTARSGYNLFIQDRFTATKGAAAESGEEGNAKGRMTQFGAEWKALSQEEKDVYNERAKALSETLASEAEANAQAGGGEGEGDAEEAQERPARTRTARAPREKSSGHRNVTAYNMFYKEHAEAVKAFCAEAKARGEDIKFMQEIGRRWKETSEEERETYKTQAAAANATASE